MPAHRENLIFNRNSSIKTKVERKKTVGRQDSTALAITAGVIYPITTTLNSPKQRHFALAQSDPRPARPTRTRLSNCWGCFHVPSDHLVCAPWKCPLGALSAVLTAEQTSSRGDSGLSEASEVLSGNEHTVHCSVPSGQRHTHTGCTGRHLGSHTAGQTGESPP